MVDLTTETKPKRTEEETELRIGKFTITQHGNIVMLRKDGDGMQILDKHLEKIWEDF